MAEGSPGYEVLNGAATSFVSTHQTAFDIGRNNAMTYQQTITDYLIEWENTLTARVDVEAMEEQKLHKILEHYETKVYGLRKQVATMEKRKKSPNDKLMQKLGRNVEKLEDAWENHEKTASDLCNLLEEITQRGWKDLYPVIRASMHFHQDSARKESDVFATLSTVEEKLASIYNGFNSLDLTKKQSKDTSKMAILLLPNDEQTTHQFVDEECVDQSKKDEVIEYLEEEEDVDEKDEQQKIAGSGSLDSTTDAVSLEHEEEEEKEEDKVQERTPPSPTGVMHTIPA
jgi:hypothetical protein